MQISELNVKVNKWQTVSQTGLNAHVTLNFHKSAVQFSFIALLVFFYNSQDEADQKYYFGIMFFVASLWIKKSFLLFVKIHQNWEKSTWM